MENILHYTLDDIQKMEKLVRANFVNSITGYKSANLIGTISNDGVSNLAVFSSVTHLGSDPALLGFVTRPNIVPRHTYANIKANKQFTVNHIHSEIIAHAHQTAARYDESVSEFEATGLNPQFNDSTKAPFVQEAFIKIACEYVNEYAIQENGTLLMVGKIQDIYLPETSLEPDGWVNLSKTNGVTINGLDSYSKPTLLDRFSYAKPDQDVQSILKKE